MRKRIVGTTVANPESEGKWLDLQNTATVEVSSEDPNHPVESVFAARPGEGWRARDAGEQKLRVIFDEPTAVRSIELYFVERDHERTQEFRLSWSPADGREREIVRQQWNFSPSGATEEVERYELNLERVSTIELSIKPDISNRDFRASLSRWRMR